MRNYRYNKRQGEHDNKKNVKSSHKKSILNQTKELLPSQYPQINIYSSRTIKVSPIKLMRKTPPKIIIQSSKKKIIEPQSIMNLSNIQEQKLFKFCMEYYFNVLNKKLPYQIELSQINNVGIIYYILNYRLFDKMSMIQRKDVFVDKKNDIIEFIFKNKKICEKLFIDANDQFGFTQLAKELSQKIKITSQINNSPNDNSGVCGDSLNLNGNNFDDEYLKKFFILNRVNKDKVNDYKIILILNGKKVNYSKNYHLENFFVYTNNERRYTLNNNKNKTEDYFIQLYLKGKPLEKVRIKNDIDISNTSDDDFNDIMDKININEEVIFVVLYNPLKYFNINNGTYKINQCFGEYETLTYINCSKKDSLLYDIFKYVNQQ